MIIVGINAYHGDASACLFADGKLIAAIEEERFMRIKHWAGFPARAIEFCLNEAGLTPSEVDYFAIGRDPSAKRFNKLKFLLSHPFVSLPVVVERFKNSRKVTSLENQLAAVFRLPSADFVGKVINVEHHRSHLASAFFASPFEEAACLSVDGSGDFTTTMTAFGSGNEIKVISSVDFPQSLGFFYTAFTQLMGFPHYGDEYKVMGMAPYGKPIFAKKLGQVVKLTDDGLFSLDLSFFKDPGKGFISYSKDHVPSMPSIYSDKMAAMFGPARKPQDELTQYHKDLAASVQKKTEEVIFHMLDHLHQKTGCSNICIAGGVAQNSVANGKITRSTGFRNVYIPSAGHDAGISLGAALYVQHQLKGVPRQPAIYSAYTGSKFSNDEIITFVEQAGLKYDKLEDKRLYEFVASRLADGAVVGWMQGRSEFGPRALGGRSILADPRRKDAKELLNLKIKRRESFRPFAPSILKEYVAEYFELDEPVPFMEKVYPIRKEKQMIIPAVTHVDGSGRLQTVDRDISPRYYDLIEAFRQKTGIPVLLNTSFNENEPIVNSPAEAINCFLRTKMDLLVMENIVIIRND